MITAIQTLKKWFSNFKKPTQEQFWAWLDSFWHKDEKIPMTSIEGLENAIQGTASAEQLRSHLTDSQAHKELFDGKVDKVPGKILSSNDFTNELRRKLEELRQVDVSVLLPRGNFSGTAQELKELIDNIMNILQSPDTELDELREVVAFIKQNKRTLDTLGIDNIAGLRDALNGKSPNDHHHDDRYSQLGHTHTEYAHRQHQHNWDDILRKPNNLATTQNIEDAINNIKIGGRNLLIDSNNFVNSWNYSKGVRIGSTFVTPRGSQYKNEATKITLNNQEWNMFQKVYFSEYGSYVLSGWVRLETATNLLIVVNNTHNASTIFGKSVITGSGWQKFVMPINVTGELQAHIHLGGYAALSTGEVQSSGDVLLWNLKLEKGDIVTDWTPAPEDLILERTGIERYDWTVTKEYQNRIVFVPRSGFIELHAIEHLGSVSFRKVFAGEQVTFTCQGKEIIYTGDNQFNGGDGSTAVVSIWNNKCYIDIRNI